MKFFKVLTRDRGAATTQPQHRSRHKRRKMNPWRFWQVRLFCRVGLSVASGVNCVAEKKVMFCCNSRFWLMNRIEATALKIQSPKEMLRNSIFCHFSLRVFVYVNQPYSFEFSCCSPFVLAFIHNCQADASSTCLDNLTVYRQACPICLRQFCFKCNFWVCNEMQCTVELSLPCLVIASSGHQVNWE